MSAPSPARTGERLTTDFSHTNHYQVQAAPPEPCPTNTPDAIQYLLDGNEPGIEAYSELDIKRDVALGMLRGLGKAAHAEALRDNEIFDSAKRQANNTTYVAYTRPLLFHLYDKQDSAGLAQALSAQPEMLYEAVQQHMPLKPGELRTYAPVLRRLAGKLVDQVQRESLLGLLPLAVEPYEPARTSVIELDQRRSA